MSKKRHLLFICTGNVFRSRQAADLFTSSLSHEARSAGTLPERDGKPVTQELIDWADDIFVMSEKEDGHVTFLQTHFRIVEKHVHVLNIPNIYSDSPDEQAALHKILVHKLQAYFPELVL